MASPRSGAGIPPGSLTCPRCRAAIQIVLEELLSRGGMECGKCGLELRLGDTSPIPELRRLCEGTRKASRGEKLG